MTPSIAERYNRVQWEPAGGDSIVESLFLKLHVPAEKGAFWIRYTLRRPAPGRGEPVGALWAVWQDMDGRRAAGCDTHPARDVAVGRDRFYLRVGPGELSMGRATGRVGTASTEGIAPGTLEWDLAFSTGGGSLVHFPLEAMYRAPFPRNRIVSPLVSTRFSGTLRIGGREIRIDDAPGMQGHNWGPTVSPHWVWCHVNTFADDEGAVFEAVSSRIRVGPAVLPAMTILYLRTRSGELLANLPHHLALARSRVDGLTWWFGGGASGLHVEGRVTAVAERTIGLDYLSADGASVRCLNSNLADAELVVSGLPGGTRRLESKAGATLELGGDAATVDVPVVLRG